MTQVCDYDPQSDTRTPPEDEECNQWFTGSNTGNLVCWDVDELILAGVAPGRQVRIRGAIVGVMSAVSTLGMAMLAWRRRSRRSLVNDESVLHRLLPEEEVDA